MNEYSTENDFSCKIMQNVKHYAHSKLQNKLEYYSTGLKEILYDNDVLFSRLWSHGTIAIE